VALVLAMGAAFGFPDLKGKLAYALLIDIHGVTPVIKG
jgi:hypothetical protein